MTFININQRTISVNFSNFPNTYRLVFLKYLDITITEKIFDGQIKGSILVIIYYLNEFSFKGIHRKFAYHD